MANIDTSTIAEQDFMAYVERLATAVRHADRHQPMRAYLEGLLLPGERKSVEPMAARVDPRNTGPLHQSMHHFVAKATWDADAVIRVARDHALAEFGEHGGVQAWIVDDTAFRKKGRLSVGVARQYCGVLGKQDNCQAVVSVSLANESMSVPAAYRLYLPEEWTNDPQRCRRAGVPDDVAFAAKWQIALTQIDSLLADRVPTAPVVVDAGYGRGSPFRDGLRARGLSYIAAIPDTITVWPDGKGPLPPKPGSKGTLMRRTPEHQPVAVKHLARRLPASAWRSVWWREGTRGDMRSRFALIHASGPPPETTGGPCPARASGFSSSGQPRKPSPNSGSPVSTAASESSSWFAWPTSGGASNATTRSSSKRSDWVTSRAAAGLVSTTMAPYASPPMPS
jgi:SRSO17 transposase